MRTVWRWRSPDGECWVDITTGWAPSWPPWSFSFRRGGYPRMNIELGPHQVRIHW